jgi:hypothetical protein
MLDDDTLIADALEARSAVSTIIGADEHNDPALEADGRALLAALRAWPLPEPSNVRARRRNDNRDTPDRLGAIEGLVRWGSLCARGSGEPAHRCDPRRCQAEEC